MTQPGAVGWCAVPLQRLHVHVLRAVVVGNDAQRAAVAHIQRGALEQWAAHDVVAADRIHCIQTERAEHEPRAHLSAVFVAGQAVARVVVLLAQQAAHHRLGLVWLAGVGEQIRHMMAGLVAMRILADHAIDIRRCIGRQFGAGGEQLVQLGDEAVAAAVQIHVPVQIVLVEEGGLPGVGFSEIAPFCEVAHAARVERFGPAAVGKPRLHEAAVAIEYVAVVARAFAQCACIGAGACRLRQMRAGPVVVGVFERAADCLVHLVCGDIAQLAVLAQTVSGVVHCTFAVRRPRGLVVDAGEALGVRLGQYHGRVVADHAAGFHALQRPDAHAIGAFVGTAHQALHQIRHTLGLHQRQQGMQCAVGVPQRVGAVVVIAAGRAVDLQIHAAIAAIHVGEQRGRQQAVIQAGVEDAPLRLVIAVDAHPAEFFFPGRHGLRMHAREVEVRQFGVEVGQRVVSADGGDADLDQQRGVGGIRVMQRGLEVRAVDATRAGGQRLVLVVQLHLFEGPRQAHGEIDVAALRPLVHAAPAGERAFVDHA